ncbi:hypothetical protein WKI68_44055 [Streptomyces sp. MS1.HAVA.3]|uniref:Fibronectin type-III domain-containing protein n=1 Tax=Streptomyces caledonius TaxID=3134107 RepID=A0ABU8UER6_9ACTN
MTTRTRLSALATTAVLATVGSVLVATPATAATPPVTLSADDVTDSPDAAGDTPGSVAPSTVSTAPRAARPPAGRMFDRWVDAVPATPAGLSATYDANTAQATLRWTASKETDLAGYRVYRRLATTSWSKVSGSALLTTPSFTDALPATGQTFLYEVRTVDKGGRESRGSLDVSATSLDRTGPAVPAGLTATGDMFATLLRWQPVADAARYEVYGAAQSAGPYTLLGTTTQPSYNDHLTPVNAPRHYRVRALDAKGNPSAFSATVIGDGVDRTPPQAPTDLTTYVQASETQVSWKMPDSFDNDRVNGGHFRLYRSPGTTLDPAALTRVTCVNTHSAYDRMCADQGMTPGAHHTYAVTAVDAAGNESALSAPVTVRSGDRVAPGPVTGLRATPRNDGMLLTWDAPAEDDIASYVAWRGVRQPDGTVRWLESCMEGTSDPQAMLCPSNPDGETYVYAVIAKDRWDNRLWLDDPKVATVTATELDLRPSVTVVTTGLLNGGSYATVITGPSRLVVSWGCYDASLCDPIVGYRVSRWNPSTEAYEPLHAGLLPTATRNYTDDTAAQGNTYHYTFEALREDGSTAMSHAWATTIADLV